MNTYHDDDVFSATTSRRTASTKKYSSRKSPSLSINGRRSPPTMRSSSLAQSLGDDSPSGRHSLAHELASAFLQETGSRALAEELGIEYDEGAQGIDESVPPTDENGAADAGQPIEVHAESTFQESREQPHQLDDTPAFDPAFDTPSKPQRQTKLPEQDPMVVLAEDLASTDKFLTHLRRLDAEQAGQPNLERLASDMIRRIDETVREREGQVRELLEYEREFRRLSGEIGGDDVLGQLDELEDLITEEVRQEPTVQEPRRRTLEAIHEESDPRTMNGADWESELDHDRTRLGDDEDGYDTVSPSLSPLKSSFSAPPSTNVPPTPKTTVIQMQDLRSYTAAAASSLSTISEQTQVNAAATTEAGRKIRALKNKLGGWRAEWESAERSRLKIERWEAGVIDVGEGTLVVLPTIPGTPTRPRHSRVDGRKIVKEHMEAFERAMLEANTRTQTIIAAIS